MGAFSTASAPVCPPSAPLQRRFSIAPAPLRHRFNTALAPLQNRFSLHNHFSTASAPLRHRFSTASTFTTASTTLPHRFSTAHTRCARQTTTTQQQIWLGTAVPAPCLAQLLAFPVRPLRFPPNSNSSPQVLPAAPDMWRQSIPKS